MLRVVDHCGRGKTSPMSLKEKWHLDAGLLKAPTATVDVPRCVCEKSALTPQMAYAHDSVRVLQCFIQFSSHQQRQQVYEELKGERHLWASQGQYLLHRLLVLLRCAFEKTTHTLFFSCRRHHRFVQVAVRQTCG